jgi:deoxyribodipyrimidine photo-lyase
LAALLQSREFKPTRDEALRRLAAFAPLAGRIYADQRNTDRGADRRDAVSTLSPYIRHRLVTEAEVLAAAIAAQGPVQGEKFITEVFWRTYWKGYLEQRPSILERMTMRVIQQTEGLERGGIGAAYLAATEGRTGIDAFDHYAKELVETGYLHNHARMWFASIWIFTLRLPWELGADFFMRHLLDGDPASNTLSWRWVAGLHTKGKNYVAQRDNINRYTEGKFFPRSLVKAAAPLDETAQDELRPLSLVDPPPSEPFALLLTDDDLGIESLPLDPALVKAVFALNTAQGRSPNPVAGQVVDFAEQAASDALIRALGVFRGCDASGTVFSMANIDMLATRIEAAGCRNLVVPYLPAGPGKAALKALSERLAPSGIAMLRVRREFDSLSWPHATRGFFQFKEKIPPILAKLGLVADGTEMFGPRERQPIVMRQR